MLYLLLVVAAMAVALVVLGLRSRRAGGASVSKRLETFVGTGASADDAAGGAGERGEPNRVARGLEELVKGRSLGERSAALLARADVRLTVGEFVLLRFAAAAGGFFLGLFLGSRVQPALAPLIGIGLALLGYGLPVVYLNFKTRRRIKQFIGQLSDTISLMANSLRAGYSLLQTMEMVSRESADPMATEFRRVVREVGLGISNQEAMQNLLRRVPSEDLDLMVTAINIQHEVGGNLAQILQILGTTIRERVRIKGEIGVLTAQQQLSGYIITALPVLLGGVIAVINPSYIGELFKWPWVCMPIGSSVLIVIAFFVMRKITSIEV